MNKAVTVPPEPTGCLPGQILVPPNRCLTPDCGTGVYDTTTGQCLVLVPKDCKPGEIRAKDGRCALPGVQAGQSCQVQKVDFQPACAPAEACVDPQLALAVIFTVVMRCVP